MTHKILKKHNLDSKDLLPSQPVEDTSGLSHYLSSPSVACLDVSLQQQFQSQNASYPLIRPTTECFPNGIQNL